MPGLLFILDPLASIKTYKDSTYAMMREADRRGHRILVCEQHEVSLAGNQANVRTRQLHFTGEEEAWYRLGDDFVTPLTTLDAAVMRKDPPFDMEYVYSTYVLERARQAGARVFNDPRAIRDHNEKLAITEFPDLIPTTLVTRREDELRAFVAEHDQVVLKLLDGMGGASIFRVSRDDRNLSVIIETMQREGAQSVMAQRYLPQIVDGDKRVLLIAGQVVPYCLARVPAPGEGRGNLARGATGRAQPLSARDREIGEKLAPLLWSRGLLLVGLDVIGDCMTELNVTSPTCFQEIHQQTGCNVAALFIDALESAITAKPRA